MRLYTYVLRVIVNSNNQVFYSFLTSSYLNKNESLGNHAFQKQKQNNVDT